MITNKMINKMIAKIKEEYSSATGIRIVDKNYDEYNSSIGDVLEISHVWEDGEYTEEELDGVSAIDIDAQLPDVSYQGYFGDKIFVLHGKKEGYGEDNGEIIISNAEIIGIININN